MPLCCPLLRFLALVALASLALVAQAATPTSIRVVLDDNYPPYSFRDAAGEPQGILKDQWDLWQKRTGISVDYQPMPWGQARAAMEGGRADAIDTIFETPERRQMYAFTQPYATIEVPIYFHRSVGGITDVASLKGFTVGVKEGDACVDYLLQHGITELRRYASYEAQVKAAVQEEIRVLCIDQPAASYFLNRARAADNFRHTAPLYTGQFHRAVAKGKTELLKVIEDGFAQISAAEYAAIEERWAGQKVASIGWPDVVRQGSYVLAALTLALVTLFGWSWSLRRRVAVRTGELTATVGSLRASERRFRTLFEQANDAILIMRGPVVIDCNHRTEALFHLSRAEIVGKTPISVSPDLQPDGRKSEDVMNDMVALVQSGGSAVFEWRNILPDGTFLDVEVSTSGVD